MKISLWDLLLFPVYVACIAFTISSHIPSKSDTMIWGFTTVAITIASAFFIYARSEQKENQEESKEGQVQAYTYLKGSYQNWIRFSPALALVALWTLSSINSNTPNDTSGGPTAITKASSRSVGENDTHTQVPQNLPFASMLSPAPEIRSMVLGGKQTSVTTYLLTGKSCVGSVVEASASLPSKYKKIQISFSLDDTTEQNIRTKVAVALDGTSTETRIISAQEGGSIDLNTDGQQNVLLTISTLGTSDLSCTKSSYLIAINGFILS